MIGPRDSVVRTLLGEDVPLDEWLFDKSPFVDSRYLHRLDMHEAWVDNVHDHVGGFE